MTRVKHILEVGQVFGDLVVIEVDRHFPPTVDRSGRNRTGERAVLVRCKCGLEYLAKVTNLVNPNNLVLACKSCSSYQKGRVDRPESAYIYQLWNNIMKRLYNEKARFYYRYGGRGITLYEAWKDFDTFKAELLAELGPRPDKMSLDRIDNDGDYVPGNLRWATQKEQVGNRSLTNAGAES